MHKAEQLTFREEQPLSGVDQPRAGEPPPHLALPTTQALVVLLGIPGWAASFVSMAVAAMPPTHAMSTNNVYNWLLLVEHYQLDA